MRPYRRQGKVWFVSGPSTNYFNFFPCWLELLADTKIRGPESRISSHKNKRPSKKNICALGLNQSHTRKGC